MARKGLNRELIVETAARLVEQTGRRGVSVRELAEALDVKPASLYNHIAGMDDVMSQVGLWAVERRTAAQLAAIEGKSRLEALLALADTYRAFAMEHRELDRVIMGLQRNYSPVLPQASQEILLPIRRVLTGYALSEKQQLHWCRALRAVMHGFCFHEHIGAFHASELPVEDSYHAAIRAIHQGMVQEESSASERA